MSNVINLDEYRKKKAIQKELEYQEYQKYEALLPYNDDEPCNFTDEEEILSFLNDLEDYSIPF